jgi:ribosomal protein S21
MIQVEVTKNNNETSSSIIRRFTKRVQESGIIRRAKGLRYSGRAQSEYVKKKKALKRIAKRTETDRLRRLGKIEDAPSYRK